jgi:hypothetical protein
MQSLVDYLQHGCCSLMGLQSTTYAEGMPLPHTKHRILVKMETDEGTTYVARMEVDIARHLRDELSHWLKIEID